ncbi:MAG: tetratricopeptide repeat protein [Sphingomonadaceae bacterium]
MNRTFLKLAASALIVGTVGMATAGEVTPKMMKAAAKAADKAMAAIKDHQQQAAVQYAERAVLYHPDSADHRALLGQAYLQAGRFHSAETAFVDSLRLAPDHGRAALGLGLVQIALGKNSEAIATLEYARGRVPVSDVGLALALAGDRDGALAILEPAARAADGSAKTRQNLALTYALAGRWAEARTTAAQDVSPAELDKRMIEWASFTRPRGTNDQVASLLGVKPTLDSGMPIELALIDAQPASSVAVQAAAAAQPSAVAPVTVEPAPEIEVASAPVSEIRPVDLPKAELATSAAPVAAQPAEALFVKAAIADMLAAKPMYVKPAATPTAMKVKAQPIPRVGNFVVQLAAYSSQDRVERGWNNSVRKVSWIGDYAPVSTTFRNEDGRTLHRLSISGFSSRIEAVNLCRKIRESGGACFVRGTAGDTPMQWVKASPVGQERYASR